MKGLVVLILSLCLWHRACAQGTLAVPAASNGTTAWHDGRFHVDVAGVIGRSDIVLERANVGAGEALPLGNGRLGVAVWAAAGLTAQLNRADTLPERLSPGQVVIPGQKEAREPPALMRLAPPLVIAEGGSIPFHLVAA